MDVFLNSLDGRLRVSGMVADSIMMGIVNSAMEDAYKKSCTKDGDLERLNEKSRFCELAIMQLEWCLKYLQEQVESSIFYETCDRDGLLYDLLETRDRILHRLEETKLAIAEKDRELLAMKEIEVDLRLALELKDEDILSLRNALWFQRGKSESADKSFPLEKKLAEKKEVNAINELKDTLDQQIHTIKDKLEEGKLNLLGMIKEQHTSFLNLENIKSGHDVDVQDKCRKAENNDGQVVIKTSDGARISKEELLVKLGLDFEEIAVGINMIEGKLDTSFNFFTNSISSFKQTLNEQQWIWNFEKETINLINQHFHKDMQAKFNNELEGSNDDLIPSFLEFDCMALMDDIRKLHNLLDILSTRIKIQSNFELRANHHLSINMDINGQDNLVHSNSLKTESFLGKYVISEFLGSDEEDCNIIPRDSFCKIYGAYALVEKDDSCKTSTMPWNSCRENELSMGVSSVKLVPEKIIGNNVPTVQKETQDINWIQGEVAEGRRSLTSRGHDTMHFVNETLPKIIAMLEFIIRENLKLSAISNTHESFYVKEQKLVKDGISEFYLYADPSSRLDCQPTNCKFFEERRQLEQEKNDLEMKSIISDDIYLILLQGITEMIHCKSIEGYIEGQIREEICKIIFTKMIEEWTDCDMTCKTESLVTKKLYSHVFTSEVKDCILSQSCISKIYPQKCAPFEEVLFQIYQRNGDMFNQIYQGPRKSRVSPQFFGNELVFVSKYNQHAKLLNWNYALNFVNKKPNKPAQQTSFSESQFGEFSSWVELTCRNVASTIDQKNCLIDFGQYAKCMPIKVEEEQFCQFQIVLASFIKVFQLLVEFKHVTHEKIHLHMKRLENLACEIEPLVKRLSSVKKKVLLYQKAFIRRCYDFQTAEEEVDLLGDQVDALHSLVEKIYSSLHLYSPTSQNASKIMDIRRLIEQELMGGTL